MDILKIADYVWKNRKTIDFGEQDEWNTELFLEKWWSEKLGNDYEAYESGWYWFTLIMSNKEIHDTKKPIDLPDKACKFGVTVHDNLETFSDDLLNKENIIYNGHDSEIRKRIRAHYILKNHKTGALGISKYSLSSKKWKISIFSKPLFDEEINKLDKNKIIALMYSSIGRGAVESAWRAKYGWPILCKL